MIIAIDSIFLSKKYAHTGTHNYAANLLKSCLRIVETGVPSMEFHAFAAPHDGWAVNGFTSRHLRVHESRILALKRSWRLAGMALNTSLVRPDLVFVPTGQGSIPAPFTPVVTTIHDVMPSRLPSHILGAGAVRSRFLLWASTKLSHKIITVSKWSKKDLVEIYGLDPTQVEVTYLAYDKEIFNHLPADPESSANLLKRFGIRTPFILHHGMVQLRKNIHRLIQAWDLIWHRNPSFNTQLVLAGPMGHGHEEILRVRESSPHRDHIIFTGALPDVEFATLVKNASLCVLPSLYEGFCLPMLEAMACGTATVASNSSCMPEVSGGLLEYFGPHSIEEIAETIQRVMDDSDLRNRLRHSGLARASEFSWERCARETLGIFEKTIAERY